MITSNWEMRDGVGLHSAMLSIIIITLLLVNRYLWQINDVIFCRDWSSGHIPRIFPISNCSVESRLDTPPCLIPHHSLTCTSWHSPDNDGNRSWQEMKGGKQTSQSVITLLQSYKLTSSLIKIQLFTEPSSDWDSCLVRLALVLGVRAFAVYKCPIKTHCPYYDLL